jgi:hypothetical protein
MGFWYWILPAAVILGRAGVLFVCSSYFSSVFLLRVGYGVVVDGNCIARRVWRTMLQLSRPTGSQ